MATPNTTTFKFNDGHEIPAIGLGTWRASEEGAAYNAVLSAIKNGYRHIDTAAAYGNEEEVGKAIKDSGIDRKDIFVTTKLWNTRHKEAEKALDESLAKLGLDYVDLYLMHWPVSTNPETGEHSYKDWTYVDTYKSLQKIYKETNKIKSLGVSNFTIPKLEKILNDPEIDVVPVVNQIELHPIFPQPRLLKYLADNNIYAQAYSPLGSEGSPLLALDEIVELSKKLEVQPANILVSWAVQRGTIVLPKSVTPSRIINNLKTIELSKEDFEIVDKISEKYGVKRTCDVPEWKAFVDDIA